MTYQPAPWDHEPRGAFFLVGLGEVHRPASKHEIQTMVLADAAEHFVKMCLPTSEGFHACLADEDGFLLVLWVWPDGAPFAAWHGCDAGFEALRAHVAEQDLVDLWKMEAAGAFDDMQMPTTGND